MTEPIRIAVTGAAGRISYSLLFRIAAGAMFGPDQPVALSLLDVPEMTPVLEATMMELDDCAFPLLQSIRVSNKAVEAFAGADWIFLLASAPFRAKMTRSEALLANGPIFLGHGRAIDESAKTARVLVVANPCDTNCLIARSTSRDVPPEHWFAMTALDESRARKLIAHKANVPVAEVTRVTAWGDHGASVFADLQNAWVGNRPAHEVIRDLDWVHSVFEPEVAGRGHILRGLRGASPAASATEAIIRTVRSLTTPTPYERWFSVATVSEGNYGVPHGLTFSFPVRTEENLHWSIVPNLYLDDHAQTRIAECVAELEREAVIVKDFLKVRTH